MGNTIFSCSKHQQATHAIDEMKAFERLWFLVRWVGVSVILLMAWLQNPTSFTMMLVWAGILALVNISGYIFSLKIRSYRSQRALSICMLAADCIVVWGVIFLFIDDFYTSAYAAFAIVIIEGAMRFALGGSLAMAVAFCLGLLLAMVFRKIFFDVRFSSSGFVFWSGVMLIVALSSGIPVHMDRKHRRESELLLKSVTLEQERSRISNELHDSVMKTLEGIALEAQVLQRKDRVSSPFVEKKAKYIEEVCHQCAGEIRDVIFNVLRDEGEQRPISSNIKNIFDSWSKETGTESVLRLSGEELRLSPEINHHLLKFIAEALNNIRQHAQASHIQASLQVQTEEINIEIKDNGHGFELMDDSLSTFISQRRFGIVTMKERIEQIGGHFSIISDHKGTTIKATIPLATNQCGRWKEIQGEPH